jgi:hypothetical protein
MLWMAQLQDVGKCAVTAVGVVRGASERVVAFRVVGLQQTHLGWQNFNNRGWFERHSMAPPALGQIHRS